MNIFSEISAALKVKGAIQSIQEAYKMDTTTVKPGWQTTEFWGKVAIQVFGVLGAVKGFLPSSLATILIGTLEGIYTIGRSFVKAKGGDLPDVPTP